MKEYRLEVKVKNNLIVQRIEKAGYKSVNDFCKKNSLHQARAGLYINLKRNPIDESGEYRPFVNKLANALNCSPDELFTEEQKHNFLKDNKKTILVNEAEVKFALSNLNNADPVELLETQERDNALHASLNDLTPREQRVITLHYGLDGLAPRSLDEIGKELGWTRQMIRQIEKKALSKLRRCNRAIIQCIQPDERRE